MRLLQQITRAAPEAFYQCVCECEACVNVNLKLPVLPSTEINKHNMRHYSRPSSRLVAETRADAREVSLRRKHTECRTRSTDAGEGTYSSGQALSIRRDYRESQHALAASRFRVASE